MNRGLIVKYPECQTKMADGRAFTDYRPSWIVNSASSMGTEQYKQYLTHQAIPLMQMQALKEIERNGCTMCTFQPAAVKHVFNL